MRLILIILFCNLLSFCDAQNENIAAIIKSSKPYETVHLKKDYQLVFATTDSLRIIRLTGPGIDTMISSKHIKASEKYVGWLKADFDNYFVLHYGYDGTRTSAGVFEKAGGISVLRGWSIDIDTINNLVFYIDTNNKDKLGLFDANTGKLELFSPPVTPCLWWFECITSKTLTNTELTIEYAAANNKRLKKIYIR